MKKPIYLLALLPLYLYSTQSLAADTVHHFPLADVIALGEKEGKLDGSVKFYLKGQRTPKVIERMGEGVSNKKTNGVGKADEASCQWAALSALITFQGSALKQGANAVVGMTSYYKKNEVVNSTTYECHVGNIMTGVALKGSYAKI